MRLHCMIKRWVLATIHHCLLELFKLKAFSTHLGANWSGFEGSSSQISVSSGCQAMSRRLSLMSNGPFALLGSSWTGFNANGSLSLPWTRKADPGQPTRLFGKDPKDCRCSDYNWLNILGFPTYFGLSKDWRTLLVAVTVMAKVIKRDCVRNLFQSWYKCREKILPGEHQWLILLRI